MADLWSPDIIKKFKERQELLTQIPLEVRLRTKSDKSYREGWVDAAKWIHQEMQQVFHPEENSISNDD
jgi:hypothetical protein